MNEEWLVIVDPTLDRQAIAAFGPITWESSLFPCLTVRVAPDQVAALRRVPGVIRLEPPQLGTASA